MTIATVRSILRFMSNTTFGPGRPNELGGLWSELAESVGSVAKLADELGISVRSVQRYAKKNPAEVPKSIQFVVANIAKKYGVQSPYKVQLT